MLFGIERIVAKLLPHNQPPTPVPTICNTSPQSINPSSVATSPVTVVYYGFNFGTGLRESLVTTSGSVTNVTSYLQQADAYSWTAQVGGSTGIQLTSDDARLELLAGGQTYDVAINGPTRPSCVRSQAVIPAQNPKTFIASHVNNGYDSNYGGNGPSISLQDQTIVSPTSVTYGITNFLASETTNSPTQAQIIDSNYILYSPPPGFSIVNLNAGAYRNNLVFTWSGSENQWPPIYEGNTSAPASYVFFIGNEDGDNGADSTSVTVTFNPLIVNLWGPSPGSTTCIGANPSAALHLLQIPARPLPPKQVVHIPSVLPICGRSSIYCPPAS